MGYVAGTLTNPTPNPAQAIVDALEAEFAAFTGNWEFVEISPVAGQPYRIWRNRGSGVASPNSWGADFYVGIWADTTTSIAIKAYEFWDTTTKKAFRGCYTNGSTVTTLNADGSFGNIIAGNDFGTNARFTGFAGLLTTGMDYYLQVSKDRVFLAAKSGTADNCLSFGVFSTQLTTDPIEPFPLYLWRSGTVGHGRSDFIGGSDVAIALSRHPGSPPNGISYLLAGLNPATPLSRSPMIGGPGGTDNDLFSGGRILVGRPAIRSRISNSTEYSSRGYQRGELIDCLVCAQQLGSSRNGDTITFDGVPYINFYDTTWGRLQVKRDA